ncbi:peptidoglycan binding protein CsiV [Veronia pacifica]|uniref:Peptidoglycan-binding protein CsiV n=1 Tax=Veronia pacifica TaxID=1080227 RepID=A0A1C3EG34_9GAMM|nr:peptidoglycan binding protein CsiV [Veronia pacifica]ODA32207.1 hypothetical protein A8L45_14205 [Veronia pacifica]
MKKILGILLCLLSWSAVAERQFDVEVIVFKRNQNPDMVKESWPEQTPAINFSGSVPASNSASMLIHDLQVLPKNKWRLNGVYKKLANHAGFQPLIHVAWRQGDAGRAKMPPIRLTAGRNYDSEYYADGTPIAAGGAFTQVSDGTDSEPSRGPLFTLDGTIRVYVQHYLFIETDLRLREPGERKQLSAVNEILQSEAPEGTTVITGVEDESTQGLTQLEKTYSVDKFLRSFSFIQKRRMRSGEIHYLDHPLMGLIIQVRRV